MRTFLSLAFFAAMLPAQTLFLVDSGTDTLYTVDENTGLATAVGPTGSAGLGTPCGLAHDGTDLYTLDLSGGEVMTLDTATGTPTFIGTTALSGWQDITWDPASQQFYAVNQNNTLYSIDLLGNPTLVGTTTGASLLTAMAFDNTGTLWAMDFSVGNIGTLDLTTGAYTVVAGGTVTGVQGMSFHPATGVLYASSTNTDSLYIVDPATGTSTLVGAHGANVAFAKGMRFQLAVPCPVPQYQTNSPPSTLDVDGVLAAPCNRAVTIKPLNSMGTANFASTNVGQPWEAGIANAPLITFSGGAITTGLGQIVNLDIAGGGVSYLNGGSVLSLGTTWTTNFSLNFQAPATPTTFSIQMLNIDPTFPDGFLLSQGCEMQAQ